MQAMARTEVEGRRAMGPLSWTMRLLPTVAARCGHHIAPAFLLLLLGSFALGCGGQLDVAQGLDAKGDLAGAVQVYGGILEEHPNDLTVLNAMALDLLLLQRYDEALEVQEKIVALDAEDAQTRVELAFNYLNHQDDPGKAVVYLEQAAALDPSAKILTFLAQAQREDGKLDSAEDSLRRAISNDARYPHAYIVLIGLLEERGLTAEAAAVRQAAAAAGVEVD